MADEIYRPIVSDEDDQSETPPSGPEVELPIRSYRDTLGEGTDQSDLSAKEAASQHRRPPDPLSAESAFERPIVKHKPTGTGPLSLKEAALDVSFSKYRKQGEDLLAEGWSRDQVAEIGNDAVERALRGDPIMPPPAEAKVLEYFGEDKKVLTPTEAANELTDWRARLQEAQQAELQELASEAAEHAQAEAQQAQPAQPAEQQPAQQQPQQPTSEQVERAQLAAERQWITYLKRIEGVEAAARNDYDQLTQAVLEAFPDLPQATAADVERLRVQDPARHAQLVQADKMLRERQVRIAALAHQRGVHEQEQAQINARARAAARARQDKHFEQLAAQHIPNWETVHGEVRAQAKKTLVSAGMSEAQINHLWNGDHDGIDAHSSVLQLVLAKAAQWDLAQEKARQIRQANLPQVIRPGTYRARDDGAQSVRELQMRLNRASGREAIRLGTALQQARRANERG